MSAPAGWPAHPVLLELDTWQWLAEVGARRGEPVDLGTVPGDIWDAVCRPGIDAVWLMGVWERSPVGRAVALAAPGMWEGYHAALPDATPADVVGSPYCVRGTVVDPALGGDAALATARAELRARGVRLVLDLVPNHTAPDHPWVDEHPERYVTGEADDLARDPDAFRLVSGHVLANGRDPYFPAWTDVVQLNAFSPSTRRALTDLALDLGERCDGVRCDMAMLALNRVFAQTWGERAGPVPDTELWADLWREVRVAHPGLLAVAESYWGTEWELQQLGFHHCYDKVLLDRLVDDTGVDPVRDHLESDVGFQRGLVRFLENHDEPRIASLLPPDRARAAAVVAATLPGALLLHDGQAEGRRVRTPIQLGRRPDEPGDPDVAAWWGRLHGALGAGLRAGTWALCPVTGWPDDPTHRSLLAWCWRGPGRRWLVVVNWSDRVAHGRVRLPWGDLATRTWAWRDHLSDVTHERHGAELAAEGLFVALAPLGAHLLSADA